MGFNIGKVIYPHLPRDQRRKRLGAAFTIISVCTVVIALLVALLIFLGRT